LKEKLKKLTTKSIAANLKREQQVKIKEEKVIEPKECLLRGETFIPTANGQRFCCKAHSNRFRQKKIREKRISQGLCPVCGTDMPKATPWGKWESLYCEKCTEIRREAKRKSRTYFNFYLV
jgi:predicted nucleic acid-binding Zn ribbon protein